MIEQNRVRQMARMAMMESEIGENVIQVCSYQRIDYVIMQILKGFVLGTVCFVALLLLWLAYLWDDLNAYFANADFSGFFEAVFLRYIVFMAVYLVICGIVAAVRYKKCWKQRTLYLKYLKRIQCSYASDKDEEEEIWSSY